MNISKSIFYQLNILNVAIWPKYEGWAGARNDSQFNFHFHTYTNWKLINENSKRLAGIQFDQGDVR